jgi:hypothetical protein
MHLKVLDDEDGKTPNYSFVTQSSGYGKSRLLEQLYQNFNTAYMCLRPSLSNGYPRRTNEIFVFLDDLRDKSSAAAEAELTTFLRLILLKYQEFLLQSHGKDTLDVRRDLASSDTEVFHSFWNSVVARKNEEKLSGFPSEILVLVIDEARFLSEMTVGGTNVFRLLRKAARELRTHLFILCVDTLPEASVFLPMTNMDLSFRPEEQSLQLHPPLWLIDSVDILSEDVVEFSSNLDAGSQELYRLFSLGRPLWASHLLNDTGTGEILSFAKQKLSMLKEYKNWMHSDREGLTAIACLASTVGLLVHPSTALARQLISSRMATLIAVNPSRSALLIDYISEPVLSEAALGLLWENSLQGWSRALEHLVEATRFGSIDEGGTDELMARIFLTLWYSLAAAPSGSEKISLHYSLRRVSVNRFLNFLDSSGEHSGISRISEFDQLFIGFTHFVPMQSCVNGRILEKAMQRRAALSLRHEAFDDFLIPVFTEENFVRKFRGVIAVQVKNLKSSTLFCFPDESGQESSTASVSGSLTKVLTIGDSLPEDVEVLLRIYVDVGSQAFVFERNTEVEEKSEEHESKKRRIQKVPHMVLRNMQCLMDLLKHSVQESGFGVQKADMMSNLDSIGQSLLDLVEDYHHGVHWYAENEIQSFELMRKMIPIAYSGSFAGQAQRKLKKMTS